MKRMFGQFWRLMALCLSGPGAKFGIVLFVIVVALDLGGIYATIRIVEWTGAFYGALEAMIVDEAIRQLGIFGIIVALNSARHLTGQWVRKHLEMRWRRSLTDGALDIWMRNHAYWHLANATRDAADVSAGSVGPLHIDNPDQRIADDCRIFLQLLLGEALDMISRVVGLVSYLVLLWSLSSFPLSLAPIGLPIEVPNYMIWAAFLYVALSSLLTHVLGYPLKGLVVEQQRREANFRFALARLRGNFDEIALSDGEAAERGLLNKRFDAIVGNWRKLVSRELILGCFTYPFQHSVLRIPLFVALPGYFAGHVAFGGLMQLSTAFSSVVTSLSWFIFSYRDLAELVAASSRLDGFLEAAKRAGGQSEIEHRQSTDGSLGIAGLALATPQGLSILGIPSLTVQPGEAVWLHGPSGLGKTTLMKALAGLWQHGSGRFSTPASSRMFLPQKPYFPIGDIREAVAYPRSAEDFASAELDAALGAVGLGGRGDTQFGRSDSKVAGSHGLSGGELQRLALARLLLHKPQWALLDEPTSALDMRAEAELFGRIREALPDTGFVIIAHRQPQGLGTIREVDLGASSAALPANSPALLLS